LDSSPVVAQYAVCTNGDSVIVCNIESLKDTIDFPLSQLFSEFEMVKLEDSSNAMIDLIYTSAVSENYLVLHSYNNGIKLYNRQGEYITDISRRGQGPDEYVIGADDIIIDEDNNSLYFSGSYLNKVLVFDLEGNPLQHIPLAIEKNARRIRFSIDKDKQLLYMAQGSLSSGNDLAYWIQDMEGNMIKGIAAGHLAEEGADFSNRLGDIMNAGTLDYAIGYWWAEDRIDSLYNYDMTNNCLRPVFTANLPSIPTYHLYVELPFHFLIKMGDYGGVLTNYKYILIDKQTLKGSYVRFKYDMLGNMDGQDWLYFRHGVFINSITPYELLNRWQGSDDFSELPTNMAKFMRYLQTHDVEEMNNVVLIGKLKQKQDEEFILKDMNW